MEKASENIPLFREMHPTDASATADILQHFANKAVLLWRTTEEIAAHASDFYVAERDGEVVGCVAFHDYGNGLFELRSLAVREDCQGQGLGAFLVSQLIQKARNIGVKTLFALTKKIVFFEKYGFVAEEIDQFPEKIWKDCQLCPKRERCDETPMAIRFQTE